MLVLTHRSCLEHDTGPGHPEHAGRLEAVLAAIDSGGSESLEHRTARPASRDELERVHDAAYVQRILAAAPASGRVAIDSDTVMSPASVEAALHAAGSLVQAVETSLTGDHRRVFCAVRPPGHHAESNRAMGFCLFNSVAVGAAAMLAGNPRSRVAVIDFDVHHGNGTQQIFRAESRVLYASTHQSPLYPGTGREEDQGAGVIRNRTLPPGSGSDEFRAAWTDLLGDIDDFRPDLVMISAGFDAHRLDPLADLNVATEDYGWLTRELVAVADRHASGRVVSALEGGYSPTALKEGVTVHLQALRDS